MTFDCAPLKHSSCPNDIKCTSLVHFAVRRTTTSVRSIKVVSTIVTTNALLARQILKLSDPHLSIPEHRAHLKPSALSFNVFGQGA
jgi:hypothetical protein